MYSSVSRFSPAPNSVMNSPVCKYHSPDQTTPKSRVEIGRKSMKTEVGTDITSPKPNHWMWASSDSITPSHKQSKPPQEVVYRVKSLGGDPNSDKIVLVSEGKYNRRQLEEDLKSALKDASDKTKTLSQLKSLVFSLEQRLKDSKSTIAALQSENRSLSIRLEAKEKEMKSAFDSEIDRLSRILTDNSAKFAQISQKLKVYEAENKEIDPKSQPESEDLCLFLIEENKRLTDELKGAKVTLQTQFSSLLTALIAELGLIRGNLAQLSVLMTCLRTGEQMSLTELLREGRDMKSKRGNSSLTADCMREVELIKKFVTDMKTVASEFYAQYCGEACSAQCTAAVAA